MSAVVVWIDSKEAKIFRLEPNGVQEQRVHAHGGKHPDDSHGKHGMQHPTWEPLFKEVSHAVEKATEILIAGHGEAKNGFKHHLEKHHAGKKVVGVIAMDHPTDKQIVAEAKKFFKAWEVFHG